MPHPTRVSVAKGGSGDKRGSSADRLQRKRWFIGLNPAWPHPSTLGLSWEPGDGVTVKCSHCPRRLTISEVEADRVQPGGSYAMYNVQPSCPPCNKARSNDPDWKRAA